MSACCVALSAHVFSSLRGQSTDVVSKHKTGEGTFDFKAIASRGSFDSDMCFDNPEGSLKGPGAKSVRSISHPTNHRPTDIGKRDNYAAQQHQIQYHQL